MLEITRNLVHVRAAGRSGLVARLIELEGGAIVIGTPTSETMPCVPELGSRIDIGLITEQGVVWYAGVVTALEPGAQLQVRAKLVGGTAGVERRSDPRAPDSLEIELMSPRFRAPVSGRLVDVSAGGLRVEAPAPVEVGEAVQMAVHVPGQDPIFVTARVVHVLPGQTETGLSFELAAAADRERLVRHAFARLTALPEDAGPASR
jgi:hypothetical protein